MRKPSEKTENQAIERAAQVRTVDALVQEGYRVAAACDKAKLEPYQYYRWRKLLAQPEGS